MRIGRRFGDLLHARLRDSLGQAVSRDVVHVVAEPDAARGDFRCASLRRYRTGHPALLAELSQFLKDHLDVADAEVEPAGVLIWRLSPEAWLREVARTARQPYPVLSAGKAVAADACRRDPLFHAQWTHATCRSVLRTAGELWPHIEDFLEPIEESAFTDWNAIESALSRHLCDWRPGEPSDGATIGYLAELGVLFDRFRDKERGPVAMRFIDGNDFGNTLGRLALVKGVADVAAAGLWTLGAVPAEELV